MFINNKKYIFCLSALIACQSLFTLTYTNMQAGNPSIALFDPSQYNVEWKTPGINSKSSMPIGNGDIGANVWIDSLGDIQLLLSKTDAFDDFNRILKLGTLHIKLIGLNLIDNKLFVQVLQLQDGSIRIKTTDASIRIWADANHPVVQIDISTQKAIQVKAWIENRRSNSRMLASSETSSAYGNRPEDFRVNADSVLKHGTHFIASCHRNIESIWEKNLKLTGLQNEMQRTKDPLKNRCFGILISSKQLTAINDTLLETKQEIKSVSIKVCSETLFASCANWLRRNTQLKDKIDKSTDYKRFDAHKKWWSQYWERSWIEITGANGFDSLAWKVSQVYALQRYVNACSGRGNLPIKFNGSIFTVNDTNDADYRAWGGCYWWQNTRLPYWSMLYSGDYDLMQALFKMYKSALPLRKLATQTYYHHKGAFFPETINFWGNYNDNNYGVDRTGKEDGLTTNTYIRRYWQSGIELVAMMLDYYDFTQDENFKNTTLLPMALEITTFYNEHWMRNNAGTIVFSPSQSLETWHTAINPTPDIAGLKWILSRLLKISNTSLSDQQIWKNLLTSLPDIPIMEQNGEKRILPAQSYSAKSNVENCELYAIFPYPLYTKSCNKDNLRIGLNTWEQRVIKDDKGWQQNCIQAALLGLSEEAQQMIINRTLNKAIGYRFPGFFGPNYDWTPDQTHPSVLLIALQRMILQHDGKKILLMPAWPNNWNVRFKLMAPYQTLISGYYENKQIKKLAIYPKSREKDIEIQIPM